MQLRPLKSKFRQTTYSKYIMKKPTHNRREHLRWYGCPRICGGALSAEPSNNCSPLHTGKSNWTFSCTAALKESHNHAVKTHRHSVVRVISESSWISMTFTFCSGLTSPNGTDGRTQMDCIIPTGNNALSIWGRPHNRFTANIKQV